MQFDRSKFKALVHYIIWKAGAKPAFGATKLNKVLWFSDAKAFVLRGTSITGAKYIREKYGPVPHQIMPVRFELEREGLIDIRSERYYDRNTTRFRSISAPDLSAFDRAEMQIVDYWIQHIADDHTAGSISDESHDYAWEIAKLGEEIPLYAFLATRMRPSAGKELDWAKQEAKRLGLT